jgi:putative transposase
MGKRRSAEQIRKLLREVDRDRAKGLSVSLACRKLGIGENAYYRWRERFGHEPADDARKVRELESEVKRLKQLVAELALDKQMLQEVVQKKW